ncbi:MAG: OsmC family protein [Alphaproteobacteria bacterium]|nr:OsmC family protein [Alphaproteobacteria bacterium]MBV9371844.1 OsmC family protein [Alphaproteobacteria bacterium]MBV9901291.1 OsmC family protein [Alphaproteobacteria bacterium]
MGDHVATVEWKASGDVLSGAYSRAHSWRFDGGAVVAASASPSNVPAPWSDPAGVDPEEALVAAVSSCHMLWFLHLAREAGFAASSYRDEARGSLGRGSDGRIAITRVVLRPRIGFEGEGPDEAALERLHHDAHARCFIANSLKGEVVVER